VADGVATGEINTTPTSPVPQAVHADLDRLCDAMAPGTPHTWLLARLPVLIDGDDRRTEPNEMSRAVLWKAQLKQQPTGQHSRSRAHFEAY